jgi:hypothetical protein
VTERSRGTKCPSDASTSALERGGRRECRVLGTPAASCAKVESTRVVTTGTPKQSGIPCAMVLTAYPRALVSGLDSHRRQPVIAASLIPASGDQDHTTSPSATCRARLAQPVRPSHPGPRFLTIAIRPSRERNGASYRPIFISGKAKYFSWRGLTRIRKISPSGKSVGATD